jgi:cell division protein FtsW
MAVSIAGLTGGDMTDGVAPRAATANGARSSSVRERWRMTVEARALTMLTAILVAFGLAVLYSASAFLAMSEDRGSAYYLLKQLSGLAVGVVAFAVAAKMDAARLEKWAWPIMLGSLFLMLVTVLPFTTAIAPRINGSRRFLIGGSVQPSELAKLAVIVWTSMLIVKKGEQMRRLSKGLFPFLVVIGALALLAALEPDLSVAMFFVLLMAIILFAGGVRIGHFVALAVLGLPVLWREVHRLDYVMARITGAQTAETQVTQVNYQLHQSLIAVGSGGWLGVGFGEGRQQYGFLPFPFNDFIGSNVGEEWGFAGLVFLVLAFAAFGWLGFRIAQDARSKFLQLVAVGLTVTIVLTAYLHIGVCIGLLPTTGLTLPFVSYGRSNLVLSLLMTGMLVNIGSEREKVVGEHATNPLAN